MSTPIALSWSRLSTYRQCPKQFSAQYITKDYPMDADNPAFVKGKEIHTQIENYILWLTDPGGTECPAQGQPAKNVQGLIQSLIKQTGILYPEKQIALNQDWLKCDWFAKPGEVKFRAIIDAMAFNGDELIVIDWKSGKFREYTEDFGQLHLTAAMMLSLYPKIQKVSCSYLFVEHKQTISITIHRSELDGLKAHFDDEYTEVNQDAEFAPKKNKYCFFCDIKADCIYG